LITFFYPELPEIDEARPSFRSISDDVYNSLPIQIVKMIADAQVKIINLNELAQFESFGNTEIVDVVVS
jgi:hypothetical protein